MKIIVVSVAALLTAIPAVSNAADYPERVVRIVVASPAGGATDVVTRIVADRITTKLGRPWAVIENVGNSGGAAGVERVTRAAPDGYTLLAGGAGNLTVAPFVQTIDYDVNRDLDPVILLSRVAVFAIANPAANLASMADLIKQAKQKPGAMNWATGGRGILPYLAGLAVLKSAGIDMTNIPYRGEAPATTDVLAGVVPMGFVGVPSASGLVKEKRLLALGISSAERSNEFPDVPTFSETLPGYNINGWFEILAPKKTDPQILRWLNETFDAVLSAPDTRNRLKETGAVAMGGPQSALQAQIDGDLKLYGELAKDFNLKAN